MLKYLFNKENIPVKSQKIQMYPELILCVRGVIGVLCLIYDKKTDLIPGAPVSSGREGDAFCSWAHHVFIDISSTNIHQASCFICISSGRAARAFKSFSFFLFFFFYNCTYFWLCNSTVVPRMHPSLCMRSLFTEPCR